VDQALPAWCLAGDLAVISQTLGGKGGVLSRFRGQLGWGPRIPATEDGGRSVDSSHT